MVSLLYGVGFSHFGLWALPSAFLIWWLNVLRFVFFLTPASLRTADVIKLLHQMSKDSSAGLIVLLFFGGLILYCCFKDNSNNSVSPRDKMGIDTVYAGDSIYAIHFTIDTVMENDEPQPDNDQYQ